MISKIQMFISLQQKSNLITRCLLTLTILSSVSLVGLKFLDYYEIPSTSVIVKPMVSQPIPETLSERISNHLSYHFVYREGSIDGDSWEPMVMALRQIKKYPNNSVYDEIFAQGVKFQYPLTSLLLFDIPERLFGIPYSFTVFMLRLLSFASMLLMGYFCYKILADTVTKYGFKEFEVKNSEKYVVITLLVILGVLFYPNYKGFQLGQIQSILTLFITIAILAWQRNKMILTGVLIGLICLIKPNLGLLFLWTILRKQWTVVISGAVVMAIFGVVSLVYYGLYENLEYLKILSFLSSRGEAFYVNQSVNGLVNRLTFNGSNLVWDGSFPPYSSIVYISTLVSSAIFIAAGLFWNYRRSNPHILDLCIIILCATVASPIAWDHHYAILFPIFIIASPFALHYYFNKKNWILGVMVLAYLLSSRYLEVTKYLADSKLNILQSYVFFAAIITFILLLRLSTKTCNKELEIVVKP